MTNELPRSTPTFARLRLALPVVATILTGMVAPGCAPFQVKHAPDGFVEVNANDYLNRYKALDNVGMNIRAFDNHEGGTIEYWAGDMLKKLGDREYVKTGESKVSSRNGVQGTRYDFDYTPPGRDDEAEQRRKFYTAALFVTKKHIVVVELAGAAGLAESYRQRVSEIAGKLKVR